MSIFRRDSEPTPSPQPAPPQRREDPPAARKAPEPQASSPEATYVASGSRLEGEIFGNSELVIDGLVKGRIDLDSRVVVGAKGKVDGEVQANAVEVAGKIRGNVRGLERVIVQASGSLEGDVISPRVIISEGAFFKGKVEMTEKVERIQLIEGRPVSRKADDRDPTQGGKPGGPDSGKPAQPSKGQGVPGRDHRPGAKPAGKGVS